MSAAQQNRDAFPGVAAMVDQVRAVFPTAKVIWATENGKDLGKRPDDSQEMWISAEGYIGLHQDITMSARKK